MDSKKGEEERSSVIVSGIKNGQSGSKLNALGSFNSQDMFFRADKVDLKSLDMKLEKKLSKVWMKSNSFSRTGPKEDWEIDASKLHIRYVVAKGTYGTVYRGTYDGQDVAGIFIKLVNLHS